MTRHVGRHKDTNEQLAVVWMLLPDSTTHALVARVDSVRDPLRRELMQAIASPEAQQSEALSDAIGRRQYADTRKSILQVLHEHGYLKATPIDEVVMTPDGNHRVPLRAVLEALGRVSPANAPADANKFNPHTYNSVAEGQNEQTGAAKNLLIEAEMLESDARAKRAHAYRLAPSLNPQLQAQRASEADVAAAQANAVQASATALIDPKTNGE